MNFIANLFGVMTVYANEGAPQEVNIIQMFMPFVLIIAVFYFFMIRPQRKKDKAHRELLSALKVTDEVLSIGGIHGKIVRVKDETYLLETGIGTQKSFIQIERAAISRLIKEGAGKKSAEPTPTFDDDDYEPEYLDADE